MMFRKARPPVPFVTRRKMLELAFGREGVLWGGHLTICAAAAVSYSYTGDIHFGWAPLYLTVVFFLRIANFRSFKARAPEITAWDELRAWERKYVLLSGLAAAGVGTYAGYATFFYPNTMVTTIAVGTVLGSMLTVVGRNFGARGAAGVMTVGCCVPLMGGLILQAFVSGDVKAALAGAMLAVVIFNAFDLGQYLYNLLLLALTNERSSQITSHRFDLAVASMPNGFLLVDGQGGIVFMSDVARRLLGLAKSDAPHFMAALEPVLEPTSLARIETQMRLKKYLSGAPLVVRTTDEKWLRIEMRELNRTEEAIFVDEMDPAQDGALVVAMHDITQSRLDNLELARMARFDGLTQLSNRNHWEEQVLERVRGTRPDRRVALAVFDIDRFKLINDTLGHAVGDKVLQGVASKLGSLDDPRLVAGRFGGDEFVVLFHDVAGEEEVREVFNRVFSAVSSTYVIEARNVEVRCSGGVVVRRPADFNLHADLSRADMALYRVKRDPDRAWALFDERLEEEYQTDLRIKNDLPRAIERGDIRVVYQPIHDAATRKVVSTEALSRWEHEAAGFISPSRFVPMAEEIGVIGQLTEYVLRTACRDCVSWGADVGVSVNLSTIDLSRNDIVPMIERALEESGLPPSRLCIEVTETVFVKDYAKTVAALTVLGKMGVKVSLDDFGTGYSSLSYLAHLPLNRVKIDKAFVNDVVTDGRAQRLFNGVVRLAKELKFEVIVEGVETEAQLDYVRGVGGVGMVQGHVFSGAIPVGEMVARRAAETDGKGERQPVLRLVDGR